MNTPNSGPIIAPFRGTRYHLTQVEDLSKVTAPPYDVISPEGQKKLYDRDPHNIIRLILGYQRPDDNDQNNRYTRSAADLKAWVESGVLAREREPSFYLYEQHFSAKTLDGEKTFIRRGFLALRRLEEFGKGIRPHEKTLAGPKADRLLLTKSCRANLSPVFSLYSDPEGRLSDLMRKHFEKPPVADFADDDGVRQRLWAVSDPELFRKTNEIVGAKSLFIADGHHRYETAVAYRNFLREQNPNAPEDASFNYVMMFFSEMSDPGLLILPTHRVLHDWPGFDAASFEKSLREWFEIGVFSSDQEEAFLEKLQAVGRVGGHAFGMALAGRKDFQLLILKENRKAEVSQVDTAILHQILLKGMLGLKEDDEKDPRFMRFVKDLQESIAARREPHVNAVFLVNPTPMQVLRDVAEQGQILPPKTTFFYPKLVSGLVLNQIVPEERVAI